MFDIILIKIAIMSENLSLKIKRNVRKKKLKKFLSKYHLKNAEIKKADVLIPVITKSTEEWQNTIPIMANALNTS